MCVVREQHDTNGQYHYHVAIKLNSNQRFLPFKLALRQRHNLASHWSTSHTQLWSVLRYLVHATDKKPVVDQDRVTYTHDDSEFNVFEESNEKFEAKLWKRRREEKVSEPKTKKTKPERFTKLDFFALVLDQDLRTVDQARTYFQDKGSAVMQSWAANNHSKIKPYMKEAREWGAARSKAADELRSDWNVVEELASKRCGCGSAGCMWWAKALEFFERNPLIDRYLLASCIRRIITTGPSKETRVPLIVGNTNTAKSTLMDPAVHVYGESKTHIKPKIGAPCPLRGLVQDDLRLIYWDDFRPVEYAALPRDNPTVSVLTFLAIFNGQPFEVQVSQSFNDGHPRIKWNHPALMTAKEVGLWTPMGVVTAEDIRHMQSRVIQFHTTREYLPEEFETLGCMHL